jgi:hypothetical protein
VSWASRVEDSAVGVGEVTGPPAGKVGILVGGRIRYVARAGAVAEKPTKAQREAKRRKKAPAAKLDPKHLRAARELGDRYLERVNDRLISHRVPRDRSEAGHVRRQPGVDRLRRGTTDQAARGMMG